MARPTDAEREAVVAVLRRHLVEERLTLDEYADLVGNVWAADNREAADAALIGLPLLPPVTPTASRRRHGENHLPAVTWRPTSERFRDPTTHRVMRVWVDVGDGTRHYVSDH